MSDKMSKTTMVLKRAYEIGYRADRNGKVISYTGRVRKLKCDTRGYLVFNIKFLGEDYPVFVHRLVAYQKFGDALFEGGIQVRHLDGDSVNNTWENIAIGTQSENMRDRPVELRREHGRLAGRANSHLSDQDVLEIRQKFSIGATLNQIMKEYSIAKSTASYIKNYKTYKYLA